MVAPGRLVAALGFPRRPVMALAAVEVAAVMRRWVQVPAGIQPWHNSFLLEGLLPGSLVPK